MRLFYPGAPSPSPSISSAIDSGNSSPSSSTRLPLDFGPLVIAMVAVVAAAFLVVSYSRLLSQQLVQCVRKYRRARRRRNRLRHLIPSYSSSASTFSHIESPPLPFDSFSPDIAFSYGLDDSVIKTIPLSLYNSYKPCPTPLIAAAAAHDCAVCLLEFEDDDYVRTLPVCSHAFHVDCIDIWLRSHANCPLCRACVLRQSSPFVPVMASRIRPSLEDAMFANSVSFLEPASRSVAGTGTIVEITPYTDDRLSRRNSMQNFSSYSEDNVNLNNSSRMLKRSYSFGFERTSFLAPSERMLVTEPATASPWKLKRAGFWGKRPLTPFKSRVFSSRYYRGMAVKSPAFFRRRPSGGGTLFPWSERFSNTGVGWGSSSSRRSKNTTSPVFLRSSMAAFSSSRLRCGDPEALLSPERLSNRG